MVTLQVPLKEKAGEPFRFSVAGWAILVAGNRHGALWGKKGEFFLVYKVGE